MKSLTAGATFPTSIQVPEDGIDDVLATQVEAAIQKLWDGINVYKTTHALEARRVVGQGGQPAFAATSGANGWDSASSKLWFHKEGKFTVLEGKLVSIAAFSVSGVGTLVPIFTLPAGYLPVDQEIRVPFLAALSGGTIYSNQEFRVTTGGVMQLNNASGSALSGAITFYVPPTRFRNTD